MTLLDLQRNQQGTSSPIWMMFYIPEISWITYPKWETEVTYYFEKPQLTEP